MLNIVSRNLVRGRRRGSTNFGRRRQTNKVGSGEKFAACIAAGAAFRAD